MKEPSLCLPMDEYHAGWNPAAQHWLAPHCATLLPGLHANRSWIVDLGNQCENSRQSKLEALILTEQCRQHWFQSELRTWPTVSKKMSVYTNNMIVENKQVGFSREISCNKIDQVFNILWLNSLKSILGVDAMHELFAVCSDNRKNLAESSCAPIEHQSISYSAIRFRNILRT